MIIGQVVEVLIRIKDEKYDFQSIEYQALIEACNVLEKLPRLEEATTYAPIQN